MEEKLTGYAALLLAQMLSLSRVFMVAAVSYLSFAANRRWGRFGFLSTAAAGILLVTFIHPAVVKYIALDLRMTRTFDRSFDLEAALKASGLWRDYKWDYISVNNSTDFSTMRTYFARRDADCEILLTATGFAPARLHGSTNRTACDQLSAATGFLSTTMLLAFLSLSVGWFKRLFSRPS